MEMQRSHRIHWLDNLRTAVIFLVVACHAGMVFLSLLAALWVVSDPATTDQTALIGLLVVLEVFVMLAVFFVSGFLMPMTLKKKKAWPFLKARFLILHFADGRPVHLLDQLLSDVARDALSVG